MNLTCPQCRHSVSVADDAEESRVKCDNCGARFPVRAGQRGRLVPPSLASDSTAVATASSPPFHGPEQFMAVSPPADYASPAVSGWAVGSFVCSLLFFIPLLTQTMAVIFGCVALASYRNRRQRVGLAWAGLIIGLLAGGAWVFLLMTVLGSLPGMTGPGTPYGYGAPPPATTQPAAPGSTRPAAALGYGGLGSPYVSSGSEHMERAEQIRDGLDRLGAAIEGFRRDNRRWPRSLDELAPVYMPQRTVDQLNSKPEGSTEKLVTLVTNVDPAKDQPERIVAYSLPVDYDDFGEKLAKPARWVLRLDGTVELIDAEGAARSMGNSRPE